MKTNRILIWALIALAALGFLAFYSWVHSYGTLLHVLAGKKDPYYHTFNKVHVGMTERDIVALLGNPDHVSSDFKVTTSRFELEIAKVKRLGVSKYYYYYAFPHRTYVVGFSADNGTVVYSHKSST